jgi:hypothetical protein
MADNKVVVEFELKGNATEKTQSLKAQMKALRDEMLKLPEGSAKWNELSGKIGEITDKMGAMSDSVRTLSGDPLERLNNSFGMIGSSIMSLDFGQAQQGLKGMAGAINDFKFKDLTTAAKGFGTTMFELGKAMLFNPIFLIGTFLVGIITNFQDLVEAGGFVGEMFGAIKRAIDSVIGGLVDFMDKIGLTDSKAKERAENQKKLDKENEDRRKKQEEQALKDAEHLHQEKERLAKEAAEKEAQRIQKIKDDQKSLTEFLKAEQEKRYQETLSGEDRELRQLRLTYLEKEKLAHGNKDLLKQLDASYQADVLMMQEKQAEDDVVIESKGLETKKQSLQLVFDETKNNYEKILEEDKKRREQEVELERASQEQKRQLTQMALGSMSALADALTANGVLNAKQSFKVNKALQLTQAGIGAVQAVQNVLADPTLIGPARFIAAASVGLTGAANVAKIAAMKFNPGTTTPPPPPGGGGGGGSMFGGGGSTSAPALDLSFLNNQQTKAQPIQSYVLATNVTSAQDAQQKILDQSKLIK